MNFNLYNSLILAGIIQGVLFAFVWLSNRKYRSSTTLYLITLILTFSVSNLQWFLFDVGVMSRYVFYSYVFLPYALAMPTLLLGYGYQVLHPEKGVPRWIKWLFLPFTFGVAVGLYYKFNVVVLGEELNLSTFYRSLPFVAEMIGAFGNLAVIGYLFVQLRKLGKDQPQRKWLLKILLLLFLGTLLWLYSEIAYLDEDENYFFYPLWIVVSIIIYWLGHSGMYKYGVNQQRKSIRSYARQQTDTKPPTNGYSETVTAFSQYVLIERNFLDSQLSLERCAEELQVSKGHLSKLINTELGQSFKEYINKLRVEEAKAYLTHPEFEKYTLVAIGLEAGFNSKSAFNTSFKKLTGQTPSEYRNHHTTRTVSS